MNAVYGAVHTAAAVAFDRVASSYDELFTHTAIGRAQRKQVWEKLLAAFPPGSRILELNCGTGEDARFLAARHPGREIRLAGDVQTAAEHFRIVRNELQRNELLRLFLQQT